MLDSAGCVQNDTSEGGNAQAPLQYSIPGIICFLQHEWTRLETERQQWHVEKAELEARLSFLQGEQKGQENLKISLIRRIKMLEHALRQERLKYAKLKRETEGLSSSEDNNVVPPDRIEMDDNVSSLFSSEVSSSNVSTTVKQGRNLLRQYLQEIGYMEKVIDIRTERVRSMLGFKYDENAGASAAPDETSSPPANYLSGIKRTHLHTTPLKPEGVGVSESIAGLVTNVTVPNSVDIDSMNENAVLHHFDFLESTTADETDSCQNEMIKCVVDEEIDGKFPKLIDATFPNENFSCKTRENISSTFSEAVKLAMKDNVEEDKKNDSSLREATILEVVSGGNAAFSDTFKRLEESTNKIIPEAAVDGEETKLLREQYTLRSHYDTIRDVTFHPMHFSLLTASDDHTIKLWHLEKSLKKASQFPEPSHTFRGHKGPVLSLCFNDTGDGFFSGAIDASIRYWKYPPETIDLYDNYDGNDFIRAFKDHTDAVHSLTCCGTHLVSASADSSIKVWDTINPKPLLCSIETKSFGIPTCVESIGYDDSKFVVGFDKSTVCIWDIEKGVLLQEFKFFQDEKPVRINKILITSSSTFIIGRDNRTICWCDANSGKLLHSITAHLDSVSSLCIDYTGMYMLSGSHDCSVRLWDLNDRTCKQDLNVHRLKHNEAVCAVAAHQSRPFFATAGADATCKILNIKC